MITSFLTLIHTQIYEHEHEKLTKSWKIFSVILKLQNMTRKAFKKSKLERDATKFIKFYQFSYLIIIFIGWNLVIFQLLVLCCCFPRHIVYRAIQNIHQIHWLIFNVENIIFNKISASIDFSNRHHKNENIIFITCWKAWKANRGSVNILELALKFDLLCFTIYCE